jgi:hypothetical protein
MVCARSALARNLENIGEVEDDDDRDRNADHPGQNTFHRDAPLNACGYVLFDVLFYQPSGARFGSTSAHSRALTLHGSALCLPLSERMARAKKGAFSGRGAIPHRRYSPRALMVSQAAIRSADPVKLRGRRYSPDERESAGSGPDPVLQTRALGPRLDNKGWFQ